MKKTNAINALHQMRVMLNTVGTDADLNVGKNLAYVQVHIEDTPKMRGGNLRMMYVYELDGWDTIVVHSDNSVSVTATLGSFAQAAAMFFDTINGG